MKILRRQRVALTYLMLVLTFSWQIGQPLMGATVYWDGSTSGSWSNSTNWNTLLTGAGTDVSVGTGNDLVFTTSAGALNFSQTIDTGAALAVNSLLFNASATSAITIAEGTAGSSLLLGGGGITLDAGTGAHVISAPLALSAAQTWANNSASVFTVSGPVSADVNLLTAGGTGNITIGGVVSGSGGLTKNDAGTLRLDGVNTFTGVTTLNAGTLMATTSAQALGTGAASLMLNGGTLHLAADASTSFGRNTTITGDVTLVADRLLSSTSSITHTFGTLSLGGVTVTVNRGVNLTSSANGQVTFGATTFTGSPIISQGSRGIIQFGAITETGGAQSLTLAAGNGASSLVILNGAGAWTGGTVVNSGTLRAAVANSLGATNGLTTVNAGTLDLRNAGAATSRNITFAGTGTLGLTSDTGSTFAIGTLQQTAGTLTITAQRVNASTTNTTHILNEAFTLNGNLVLNTVNSTAPQVTTLRFQGAIADGAGTNNLSKTGGGVAILEAAAAYDGLTTITQGTLRLGVANALPSGAGKGDLTLNPATGNTATLDLNGFNQTLNGLSSSGAGTSDINNAAVAAATLTIGANNGAGTFLGTIQNTGGAISVVKTGSGTISLAGTGTYTGTTTVNGGTLAVTPAAVAGTAGITVGATGNGTFSLGADSVGSVLALPANAGLTLGGAANTGTLHFQLGADTASSDRFLLSGTGLFSIGAGGGIISATPLGGFTAGTYDLLSGPNNIVGGASLLLGNLPGGFTYALDYTTDPKKLSLIATAVAAGDLFWRGDVNSSWAESTGGNTNWSSTANGLTEAGYTPGPATTVNFSATNAGASPVSTVLDNAYFIAGLRILNSGTGAVTIAPGTNGSLTVGAGGIDVQAGAPATTVISAPVTVGAAQNWTVADGGSTLEVSGAVSGAATITKNGAGTLVLTGDNSFTGQLSLAAGTLRAIGTSNNLLGTGAATLVLSGGELQVVSDTARSLARPTTISGNVTLTTSRINTGAGLTHTLGTLSIGAHSVLVQAGAPTDSGTQAMSFGATTLTGSPTFTINNNGSGAVTQLILNSVTESGGSYGLTKSGDGTLRISGTSTYTGLTLVTGGSLEPTTTNTLSPNSTHSISAGASLRLISGSTAIGGLSGAGIVENGSTSSTRTLTVGGNNASTTFSGTLQNGATQTLSLTKVGTGTLTLSGTSTALTGGVTVSSGTLEVTGTFDNGTGATAIGNSAGLMGVLRASGTSYDTSTLSIGNNATGFGVLVINGADVAANSTATNAGTVLANTAGGYGGLFMSSGAFSTRRLDLGSSAAAGTTVVQMSGGTFGWTEYILARGSKWEMTFSGVNAARTDVLNVLAVGEGVNSFGALTLMGGTLDNSGQSIAYGRTATGNTGTSSTNLNAGLLTTNNFTINPANFTAAYFNFNGGTLRANIDSATFMPAGLTGVYVNGAFGSFTGGAVIDSNGRNITLAANLLAPTGSGVNSIPLTSGGSGYLGAPYVEITGGGGVGATATANVDMNPGSPTFGQVTGITITNPGVGYTSAPTVTFVGGGGTGAAIGTVTTAVNTSGGLTKTGAGTLTLSGANTYTGLTTVNGGTLSAAPGAVASSSGLQVGITGNAAFDLYQDGIAAPLNLSANAHLILGSSSTSGALGFQLGATGDVINLSGSGTFTINAGGGIINALALGGFAPGTYDLVTSANPIVGAANLQLGNLPGGFTYSLDYTTNPNVLKLVAMLAASGNVYWRGDLNSSWSGFSLGNTNWSSDAAGTTEAGFTPGSTNVVNFSATNAGAAPITTTLDAPVSIQGLSMLNSGTGAVTIAPGSGGSLTLGSGGIQVLTGAPATTLISAPVILGAAQTWNVADSGSQVSATGVVSGGPGNSTQAAPGSNVWLTIMGGGSVSFGNTGNTFTGDILVDGGTFVVDNLRDWGSATIASTDSHSVILDNGGVLQVTASLNPGATTTTSYNLVKVNAGGGRADVAAGVTLTLDDVGQLYGSGPFTKSGPGTFILRNQNTFAGTLDITAGLLQMSGTTAFGLNTAGTTIRSGAALNMAGQTLVDTEPLTVFGTGLAAAPAGVITNSSSTSATFPGPITLGSNSTFGVSSSGSLTLSGMISGAFTVTGNSSGTGTVVLSGNNTFSGGVVIDAGILRGVGVSPTGTTVAPTSDPFGSNTITLNGGTLDIRDNADGTTTAQTLTYDNPVVLNASATVNANRLSGTGTAKIIRLGHITLAGGITFTSTNSNDYQQYYNGSGSNINTMLGDLTVNVNAETTTFANGGSTTSSTNVSLTDGAGSYKLTKTGAGSLTLGRTLIEALQLDAGTINLNSAANAFPAGVVVNGGTLVVNNSNGVLGAASSPDVQVNGGTIQLRSSTAAQTVGLDFNANATLDLRNNASTTFQVESLVMAPAVDTFTFNVNRTSGTGTGFTETFQGPITTQSAVQFNVTGGNSYSAAINATSTITLGGNITFNPTTANLAVAAVINDGASTFSLTKTGTGVLTLSAANLYKGATSLNEGTLLVANSTGSATGTGTLTAAASTILGGTGIIAPGSGNGVIVNGTLQVGGAAPVAGQTLTIATNAAATTINNLLTFDLFSGEGSGTLNALSTADRLLFTGNSNGATVSLGASSVLGITTSIVSGWTPGSSWQLIDWAGLTPSGTFSNLTSTLGNFASLPDLSTLNLAWDVSAIYSTGVVSIVLIPEPGRAMLVLFGLLAFLMRRRRHD
jgi:autotransporter-associated beta strand protein